MSLHTLLYPGLNGLKSRFVYASKLVLSQRLRNQAKKWQASSRKRWSKALILLHGRYGSKDLVDQIRGRVADDFEILMVHSAYDRLQPMYSGRAQELVQELINFCRERGATLVMPAFVLGGRSYNPREYYQNHNFDVRRTPSEMGLLTEIFRRMPGVIRSLHPTHSVAALGPLAELLTSEHHLATTRSGHGTPFETMSQRKTIIIGLGVEYFRCLTQIHAAQDLMGDDSLAAVVKERFPVTIVDVNGNKIPIDFVNVRATKEMNNGLVRTLLPESDLQEWKYKGTPLFLTFADKVTNCLIHAASRGVTVYGRNETRSTVTSEPG